MRKIIVICMFLFAVLAIGTVSAQSDDSVNNISEMDNIDNENTLRYLPSSDLSDENSKNQTEFISSANKIYYKADYSISLRDSNSKVGLANKTVNFVINNIEYKVITDKEGIASVNLNLAPGKYRVSASFSGDDFFNSSNFNADVDILPTVKAADISKYYKGSTKYSATFYDSDGNLVINRVVTVTVNGKSYHPKTSKYGSVSLDVNLKPGTYRIVSYDPLTDYKVTTNFVILPTVISDNLNKVAGDGRKFSAKFLKSNGLPVKNQYIKFKIKGKIYKVKTNKNGFASLSLKKLKKGTYKITCYNKDGFSKTNTVKVFKRKASTKLTASDYIFKPGDDKLLKVRFSTALADKSQSGKIIKIKINGKTYSKKTDSKGMAYLDLSFLKKGIFTVKYTYSGNNFFKSSSSKSLVRIYDTLTTSLNVKGTSSFGYGAGTALKVAYTAGGVPLSKKTVSLDIDGKTYVGTTDSDGIASFPVNLNIGSYTINYKTYDDSAFYPTSGSFDINVFERSPSKITWKSGSSFKDNSQTFKLRVTDLNGKALSGGKIKLTIDSKTYSASVSSKGYASVKTSVDIGKYNVSYKYEGDNNHNSDSGYKYVNVKVSKFSKGLNQKNAAGLKVYLKSSKNCKVGSSKIKSVVKSLTKGLSDNTEKAKVIFNYVRDNIVYSYYYNSRYGALKTLNAKRGNCADQSNLLVSMYRTAGLHARYVHGKCHFKSGLTTGHVWVQVKIGKNWVCADPISYGNSLGKIHNWNTRSYRVYGIYSSLPF